MTEAELHTASGSATSVSTYRSQNNHNMSYSSMYSSQFTSRMQKIQQIRAERSRAKENDWCETRAVRTGFVFPSTQHMDHTRGPGRGFDGFRSTKLPPNCVTYRSNAAATVSVGSQRSQSVGCGPQELEAHAPEPPPERVYSRRSEATKMHPRSPVQEVPERVNRVLYPPSPPSGLHGSNARRSHVSHPSGQKKSSVAPPSGYHLILNTTVSTVTGSMEVISERMGLVATTSDTNKIALSVTVREQLSLRDKCFSIKIVNSSSSGGQTVGFSAQFTSTDPRDMTSLSPILHDQSKIHITIMSSPKKAKSRADTVGMRKDTSSGVEELSDIISDLDSRSADGT